MLVTKEVKNKIFPFRPSMEDESNIETIAELAKLYRTNGKFAKTKAIRLALSEYAKLLKNKKK